MEICFYLSEKIVLSHPFLCYCFPSFSLCLYIYLYLQYCVHLSHAYQPISLILTHPISLIPSSRSLAISISQPINHLTLIPYLSHPIYISLIPSLSLSLSHPISLSGDKILLSSVPSLVLSRGQMTRGRRSNPVPQLACNSSLCSLS